MVSLVDLENPQIIYQGRIFWDMVRPGVRLPVLGPDGCTTSVIKRVVEVGRKQFYIRTRHSRYLLTEGRMATRDEIGTVTVV
ncbi:hypothetical protein ACFL6C_07600 [Myxococcota bacterium]